MSVSVSVVSVIVKRPVLPPCAVVGRSRNPVYYYYTPVVDEDRVPAASGFVVHTFPLQPPAHHGPFGARYSWSQ